MAEIRRYDPHPAYRPEIDGMRAVAVLAVVAYHFDLPLVGGGLVGVDIFFVISGFLIGGILLREKTHTGTIRLGSFYLRRIRRLAPAYFAMATASLVAAWFVLLPFEAREFGKELIAATVYLANINYFRDTGYFDIGIENKVLLHSWSLAVEEQFYLVLPIAILAVGAGKARLRAVLAVAFAASLLADIWLTPRNQPAAFYLFPLRAWELLAGVLLAMLIPGKIPRKPGIYLSWAGMALMLAAIFWVRPGPAFPGWQAAVPVAGAVLALAGGQAGGPVNRVLSAPLPVFVGRISYSLYLWHWPVLTLSKYARGGWSGPLEAAFWALLALGLSILSWRLVEQPVRRSRRLSPRVLVGGWLLGSALLLGAGALFYTSDGLARRFEPETRAHIAASGDFLQDWSRCARPEDGPFAGTRLCPLGPEGAPELLVWGDSHARGLYATLDRLAREAGRPAAFLWIVACPPFVDVTIRDNTTSTAERAACRRARAQLADAAAAGAVPPRLLLIGRWNLYAEGRGIGIEAGNILQLSDAAGNEGAVAYDRAMRAALRRFSSAFEQVFVLRQPPAFPDYDARRVARDLVAGRLDAAGARERGSVSRAAARARAARAEAPLEAGREAGRITLLDPWPYFCDREVCRVSPPGAGGKVLYVETNHLNNSGGAWLTPLLRRVFEAEP